MIKPVSKTDEATFIRGFKARCENISIQFRQHLNLAESAPLPARKLASYLGVSIWELETVPGLPREALRHLKSEEGDEWSALAVKVRQKDIIVLNPRHSDERQCNDLMHELAHIILRHKAGTVTLSASAGVGFRSYDKLQEAEADWLSASLLLPRPAVAMCHGRGMDAEAGAAYFGVTPELYTYRLRITGVVKQFSYRAQRAASVQV